MRSSGIDPIELDTVTPVIEPWFDFSECVSGGSTDDVVLWLPCAQPENAAVSETPLTQEALSGSPTMVLLPWWFEGQPRELKLMIHCSSSWRFVPRRDF